MEAVLDPVFNLARSLLDVQETLVAMVIDGAFDRELAFRVMSFLSSKLLNKLPAFIWDVKSSAQDLLTELQDSTFVRIAEDHKVVLVVCSDSPTDVHMPENIKIVKVVSYESDFSPQFLGALWDEIASDATSVIAFPQPCEAFYHRGCPVTVIYGGGDMDGVTELFAEVCRPVQYGQPVFLYLEDSRFSTLARGSMEMHCWQSVRSVVQGAHVLIVHMHKREQLKSVFVTNHGSSRVDVAELFTNVVTAGAKPVLLYNQSLDVDGSDESPDTMLFPSEQAKVHIRSLMDLVPLPERIEDQCGSLPFKSIGNLVVRFPKFSERPAFNSRPCVIGGRTVVQLIFDRTAPHGTVLKKDGFVRLRVPDESCARRCLIRVFESLDKSATVVLSGLVEIMFWDEAFWYGLIASQIFGVRKVCIEWPELVDCSTVSRWASKVELVDAYCSFKPDSGLRVGRYIGL